MRRVTVPAMNAKLSLYALNSLQIVAFKCDIPNATLILYNDLL